MKVFVDTREKENVLKLLKQLGIPYERKYLEAGDFETEGLVCERKTIFDFISSIRSMKLFSELRKLSDHCESTNKVPLLMISGTIDDARKLFDQWNLQINEQSVWGGIASSFVRYGVSIIWNLKDDRELLYIMHQIAEKIAEGKFMMPHRMQLRRDTTKKIALVCEVLHVSPTIAKRLIDKFGSLKNILLAEDKQLRYIDGIGDSTLHRIRNLVG